MIKYKLKCSNAHEFDVWFNHSTDYDEQAQNGLLMCPYCQNTHIEKALMAPFVKTKKQNTKTMPTMQDLHARLHSYLEENCKNVGENFAKEARAQHYGEKLEQNIYGTTTRQEAKALLNEGIAITPLPINIAPKDIIPSSYPIDKKKIN